MTVPGVVCPSAAGVYDPAEVVSKLTELGWTEGDAKEALVSSTFPTSANTEEIIKIILSKC